MSFSLIDGEKIFSKTHPHPLAMVHIYLCWLYISCVGVGSILFKTRLIQWIASLPVPDKLDQWIFFIIWASLLVIPAAIVSFIRVNLKWLLLAVLLSGLGACAHLYRQDIFGFLQGQISGHGWTKKLVLYVQAYWPFKMALKEIVKANYMADYFLILVGIIGLFIANSYRRSHCYYITNRRIITRFGFLVTRERDLLYSKVDDLIVHQDLLGRLLNFGTIIPISASGIGTGGDQVLLLAGAEQKLPVGPSLKVTIGGGKSVIVPRAPSFYSLYGVPSPDQLRRIMVGEMEKREHGHTRRLTEDQVN